MEEPVKLNESDYLKEYKCKYCDGTHCTVCTHDRIKKNTNLINNNSILLYEEPRTK